MRIGFRVAVSWAGDLRGRPALSSCLASCRPSPMRQLRSIRFRLSATAVLKLVHWAIRHRVNPSSSPATPASIAISAAPRHRHRRPTLSSTLTSGRRVFFTCLSRHRRRRVSALPPIQNLPEVLRKRRDVRSPSDRPQAFTSEIKAEFSSCSSYVEICPLQLCSALVFALLLGSAPSAAWACACGCSVFDVGFGGLPQEDDHGGRVYL